MRGKTHCLEVWGEFACFTRPEMKVERYSYPVITPSAARGILRVLLADRESRSPRAAALHRLAAESSKRQGPERTHHLSLA